MFTVQYSNSIYTVISLMLLPLQWHKSSCHWLLYITILYYFHFFLFLIFIILQCEFCRSFTPKALTPSPSFPASLPPSPSPYRIFQVWGGLLHSSSTTSHTSTHSRCLCLSSICTHYSLPSSLHNSSYLCVLIAFTQCPFNLALSLMLYFLTPTPLVCRGNKLVSWHSLERERNRM